MKKLYLKKRGRKSISSGLIDISVRLKSGMVHWPGDPPVKILKIHSISKGDAANVSKIDMGSFMLQQELDSSLVETFDATPIFLDQNQAVLVEEFIKFFLQAGFERDELRIEYEQQGIMQYVIASKKASCDKIKHESYRFKFNQFR